MREPAPQATDRVGANAPDRLSSGERTVGLAVGPGTDVPSHVEVSPSDRAPGFTGVIALDGPSGTGKSTVARRLAARLGLRYLDTGAMYRAATLAALQRGVDLLDPGAIARAVADSVIAITTDPAAVTVTLDGRRVDTEIRGPEVTAAVSAVSAVPAVREQLVAAQRQLIGEGAVVVEGRDIGTVVCPDAALKVFVTAHPEIRAQRRAGQLGSDNVQQIAASLERRDALDSSRATSPLIAAADAVELDTTDLSVEQTVRKLVHMTLNRQSDND